MDKQFTTALVINYKIFKSKGPELSILAESFSKANCDPNRIFFKGKNITSKLKVTEPLISVSIKLQSRKINNRLILERRR